MNLSRRHLAAAGALALSAPTLIRSAHAEAADETAVKTAVEELRMAWFKQDKAKLDSLTADQLSYSHSDAHLEDKTQFINGVMTRKATFKSLEWPELTVQIVGNSAVVRHLWVSESESTAKSPIPKLASCKSGRNRTAAGSCWRVRHGGCRRQHSATLTPARCGVHPIPAFQSGGEDGRLPRRVAGSAEFRDSQVLGVIGGLADPIKRGRP